MTGPRPERAPDDELAAQVTRLWAAYLDSNRVAASRSRALIAFASVRHRPRWLLAGVAAAAVMSVGAVGATAAAQDALPGDATYRVKLGLERVELTLARGPEAEAGAWLDIAETRLEEVVRAQAEGRFAVIPEILVRYTNAIAAVRAWVEAVQATPSGPDVAGRAARELRTHEEVLEALLEVAPPAARAGLERARNASHDAHGVGSSPPHVQLPPEADPRAPGHSPAADQPRSGPREPVGAGAATTPAPPTAARSRPSMPTAGVGSRDRGGETPRRPAAPGRQPEAGPPGERPYP